MKTWQLDEVSGALASKYNGGLTLRIRFCGFLDGFYVGKKGRAFFLGGDSLNEVRCLKRKQN